MTTMRGDTLTLDNASRLLVYDPEHQVVVCTEHRYALQGLDRHLKRYHGGKAIARKQAIASYSMYPILRPEQVRSPAPLGPPKNYLGKPVKALHCDEDECDFISLSWEAVQRHCASQHDWHATRSQRTHWSPVWAQTFFVAGKQRYFTVDYEKPALQPSTGLGPLTMETAELGLIKGDWSEEVEKHGQEMELADAEVAKQDHTGWFNRTGWPEHLKGADLKHLAAASDLPARDERHLARAAELVDKLVEKSVAGLSTLHHETRRWLKSPKAQESDPRTLARLQNRDSQLKYARYLKRFVCYSLRVAERALAKQTRLPSTSGRCHDRPCAHHGGQDSVCDWYNISREKID